MSRNVTMLKRQTRKLPHGWSVSVIKANDGLVVQTYMLNLYDEDGQMIVTKFTHEDFPLGSQIFEIMSYFEALAARIVESREFSGAIGRHYSYDPTGGDL